MSRKIILYVATSLDGFIAAKDGSVKWLDKYDDAGGGYGYEEFFKSIDSMIMGNTTYEQVLTFGDWPYKGKKCYIMAHKAKKDPNVTFVKGDVQEIIKGMKGNIWLVGGANIVKQFLEPGLIDEFIIFVMPEKLGEGIKLFEKDNQEKDFTLRKKKKYKTGIVEYHYSLKA